ncbi:hypothetical protein PGUG_01140 [Meyerozyma guilliermondii ATCC 6260]|uniref:histone acetyltransferase n=1 Tax=Meyerozyma guilliermondii (strain ATCC 6260 / CBS 566 / DSM 6381 / JCM 1539 / NBRC 10279 / NRRL Y-324) TaxID=294746 RepID=A5DCY5_PICGU|nr:uncharacterized protein PGUG_01140 [Meyerozyma guilliermondii ATCC 6260]EDK37042.2 hypothetical protein PGUG_01140 [Meyerozyma guilliermondii ATCC 6260]
MTLGEALAPYLPKDTKFKALHVYTVTYETKDFICVRTKNPEKPQTFKNKHFLALVDSDQQIILGLELYVYLICTNDSTINHIFVSKADTTGLSKHKVKVADIVRTMISYVDNIDIKEHTKHVERKRKAIETHSSAEGSPVVAAVRSLVDKLRSEPSFYRTLVHDQSSEKTPICVSNNVIHRISLFTRSSEQYLFPESSENKNKHIINGNQLLEWWIGILDGIAVQRKWQCYVTIPGSDSESMKKYISKVNGSWTLGSIFDENENSPAIYTIPLLPDDPKGRFLEHLVVEGRHKTVSTKDFWEELGFRQEFRIGNVVGILGCESSLDTKQGSNMLPKPVKRAQYRQVIKAIKRADFSDSEDVRSLVEREIPNLIGDVYEDVIGTQDTKHPKIEKRSAPVVNNITGLVKRKKQ